MKPLPYAYGKPPVTANIKAQLDDFQVNELLGFEPEGKGEHQFLLIRKRNANTEWVARQLARWAKVKPLDVSYAGLKDRYAVTTQWFSVRLANKPEPDWQQYANAEIEFLTFTRHTRKLKRGALKGNRFKLTLRNLAGDLESLPARINTIAQSGVPNYFGEQRFGQNNLAEAEALFTGMAARQDRHQLKMYISAARSFLFNAVLAARVEQGTWDKALAGDIFMLDGTHSIFTSAEVEPAIANRIQQHDIHPTGPLWGNGELSTKLNALMLEQTVLADYPLFCSGLAARELRQERRALRVVPGNMAYEVTPDRTLSIEFELPAGCYATAVLREICDYT